ncbi:MAG TPA: glycoside hydrolase family 15 protein [Solirubrobacteraceae bacterium]|nr:glycoside hydrolase family 15 protein [Solirubrobacteraceae bacterium]
MSVEDLAFLSDCRTAAMVTRAGEVVWWPGPRFDGPSVFTKLLDPDAGRFALAPANPDEIAETTRTYVEGTLVLCTEHRMKSAARLIVHDALALEAGAVGHEIGHRSPDALVRVVEAQGGDVEVQADLVPRPEYGLAVPRVIRERGRIVTVGGPERLFVADAGVLSPDGSKANARFTLRDGERRGFVVHRRPGVRADGPPALDPFATLAATVDAWRSWSDMHHQYEGPFRAEVLRTSLILQGLTYQPTGAVVAAPTTSLPERSGEGDTWDYRFAWLRDASLIARAMLDATCSDEAVAWFDWMTRAAVSCRFSSHVQIVFGVGGERQMDECALDHLRGWRDSRPVRIGNAAWRQRQLDVLGEVLDVAHALHDVELLDLDEFTAGFLCQLVDRAAASWREPDRGMWERRDHDLRHTMAAALCWVALDRGVKLADALGEKADPDAWARVRDEVYETVMRDGWSEERGAFVSVLGGDLLDASLLLLPLYGVIAADDPRMVATCDAIERELAIDGLLRRSEERPFEPAFLPATFWLAAARAQAGDPAAARKALERGAACANDLGLLSEMYDPVAGEQLGNTPQALSHVAMVAAARSIQDAEGQNGRT